MLAFIRPSGIVEIIPLILHGTMSIGTCCREIGYAGRTEPEKITGDTSTHSLT